MSTKQSARIFLNELLNQGFVIVEIRISTKVFAQLKLRYFPAMNFFGPNDIPVVKDAKIDGIMFVLGKHTP